MSYREKTDEELIKDADGGGGGVESRSRGAQAEMMRRLKNAIEKFDKTTTHHNRSLIALTLILIVVALVQLVTTIAVSSLTVWVQVSIELIALGIIVYAAVKILKNLDEKK